MARLPTRPALQALIARLRRDTRGAMLIETAIVAPALVLMSLGAYQVSSVVARQSELQSAVSEGSAIALAALPTDSAKRTTLKNVIVASTNLASDKVSVTPVYRCEWNEDYVNALSDCDSGDRYSSFVKIAITDTYDPIWTNFGVGSSIQFNVERYVMLRQDKAL